MKVSTNRSHWELDKNKGRKPYNSIKKKTDKSELKKILEETLTEQKEDWEEFRILLPQYGQYWDNGYEDLK